MQSSNVSSSFNAVNAQIPIKSLRNVTSIAVTQSIAANVEETTANSLPTQNIDQPEGAIRKKANGQTGPKSIAGKRRSRFNALKSGRYAKSQLLPFEDAKQYSRHCKEIYKALDPVNYIEAQLADDYAKYTWRIQRHETRNSYEREKILEKLTPAMAADFIGVTGTRAGNAPEFLVNLSYRIPASERQRAQIALNQYEHLMTNAKGIQNFNLVWRQYKELFEALAIWIDARSSKVPLFSPTGQGLSIAWQQQPAKLLEYLGVVSDELYYIANWDQFRPQIRVWMEAYYFLQRQEQYHLTQDEHLLIKERNYANGVLDRLMRLRKGLFDSAHV